MRRVIRRHIRHRANGLDLDVDLNAVLAINRGSSEASTAQSTVVTQEASARAEAVSHEETAADRPEEDQKEER